MDDYEQDMIEGMEDLVDYYNDWSPASLNRTHVTGS